MRIVSSIILIFCLAVQSLYATDEVMDQVTDGVCQCLQTCKKQHKPIKSDDFQACLKKNTKAYAKQLKKIYKTDEDDMENEIEIAQKIAMQLALTMATACPDMLQFILEEFPEFSGDH